MSQATDRPDPTPAAVVEATIVFCGAEPGLVQATCVKVRLREACSTYTEHPLAEQTSTRLCRMAPDRRHIKQVAPAPNGFNHVRALRRT